MTELLGGCAILIGTIFKSTDTESHAVFWLYLSQFYSKHSKPIYRWKAEIKAHPMPPSVDQSEQCCRRNMQKTVNLQHSHASRIASNRQVSQTHSNHALHQLLCWNRFGKDISHHSLSVAVGELHFLSSNTLTHKVVNDINVLRPD